MSDRQFNLAVLAGFVAYVLAVGFAPRDAQAEVAFWRLRASGPSGRRASTSDGSTPISCRSLIRP